MISIGDTVSTKALNGATFSGTVIKLDRFGFAVVSFDGVSESRIQISQLTKALPMNSKCEQCGKELDLLTAFTKYQICGKCTRANHKKAVNK